LRYAHESFRRFHFLRFCGFIVFFLSPRKIEFCGRENPKYFNDIPFVNVSDVRLHCIRQRSRTGDPWTRVLRYCKGGVWEWEGVEGGTDTNFCYQFLLAIFLPFTALPIYSLPNGDPRLATNLSNQSGATGLAQNDLSKTWAPEVVFQAILVRGYPINKFPERTSVIFFSVSWDLLRAINTNLLATRQGSKVGRDHELATGDRELPICVNKGGNCYQVRIGICTPSCPRNSKSAPR